VVLPQSEEDAETSRADAAVRRREERMISDEDETKRDESAKG
jgi:hypothetical protein